MTNDSRNKDAQTAGEDASLGGHSTLKPDNRPEESVSEDRRAAIGPGVQDRSEEYLKRQQESEGRGAVSGDSTEGSREFIGRGKPGSGSSRKTGEGVQPSQDTPTENVEGTQSSRGDSTDGAGRES